MKSLRWLFAAGMLAGTALGAAGSAKADANECPVRASLTVVAVDQKGTAQLVLTLEIADTWYIYTKSSRSAVLEIDLQLPPGVTTDGDWIRPKPRAVYQDERVEVYSGEKVLRRNLRLNAASAAPGAITATVRFQACDPTICRPPEEISVSAKI